MTEDSSAVAFKSSQGTVREQFLDGESANSEHGKTRTSRNHRNREIVASASLSDTTCTVLPAMRVSVPDTLRALESPSHPAPQSSLPSAAASCVLAPRCVSCKVAVADSRRMSQTALQIPTHWQAFQKARRLRPIVGRTKARCSTKRTSSKPCKPCTRRRCAGPGRGDLKAPLSHSALPRALRCFGMQDLRRAFKPWLVLESTLQGAASALAILAFGTVLLFSLSLLAARQL